MNALDYEKFRPNKNLKSQIKKYNNIIVSNAQDLGSLVIFYDGKKPVTANEVYKTLGFGKGTVICGKCFHRGTLRKRGKYGRYRKYNEVLHTAAEAKSHYFGKHFKQQVILVPITVVFKN